VEKPDDSLEKRQSSSVTGTMWPRGFQEI